MSQIKLREQAYDAFTRHLLDRRLLPGQFVSQRELADRTSMSLAAIREMIPRLEAEGLIRAINQRGLQIVHVDLQMVIDAFQLREMIETTAIVAFVRKAPAEEVEAHAGLLDRLLEQTGDGSAVPPALLEEAQRADWALHDAFVATLGNRILADIHRVNSIRIRMILQERISITRPRMPSTLQQHKAILDAIRGRDEAAAVAALKAHLACSRERALGFEPFDDTPAPRPAGQEEKEPGASS